MTTRKIIPINSKYLGDEKYVQDQPLLRPPPLEPPTPTDPDQIYGPNATIVTKRPYVTVFYGSKDFNSLSRSQSLFYGLVRSWNDCDKECRMSVSTMAAACGVSSRQGYRIVDQLVALDLLRKNPDGPRPGQTMILEARRNV